ncbi:U32 family peptidase [Parendozoicomonas sp. Alg238-R29]|uniref:U32 family peptidase n=1 Tax=Parendozoicomonas sp. Alg238-R29 TaxID=2993446 RepID=UPI00248DB841|nr:U32 family peptidase [Parendozoicomonas sp. Alg238-R29]
MEITLGPLLYFWPKDRVISFYRDVCEWPVNRVYLGETVCNKRRQMKLGDWLAIGEELQSAGKTVVLSTLALLEAASDLAALKKVCDNDRFHVEANDMAAVHKLSQAGIPFTTGPLFNIYNAYTLKELIDCGLERWTLPLELSATDLYCILGQADELGLTDKFSTEVFVWGMMPLAVSARCFTARAHDLPKDDCQFVCMQYPEGLPVYSQENDRVFTLNGIQTQSGRCLNLLGDVPAMAASGVDAVRVSPQPDGTKEVVLSLVDQVSGVGEHELVHPAGCCQGYWHGKAGMVPMVDITP